MDDDDYFLLGDREPVEAKDSPQSLNNTDSADQPRKKAKRKHDPLTHPELALVEQGRDIRQQSIQDQAEYLNLLIRHYYQKQHSSSLIRNTRPHETQQLTDDTHKQQKEDEQDEEQSLTVPPTLPNMVISNRLMSTLYNDEDILSFLQRTLTKQTLQKWKHKASPCVVILCLSARRCAQLLQVLAPLKCLVGKLFPKAGSVGEQTAFMKHKKVSIVVGTPQRLLDLLDNQAFSLEQTSTLVLDAHLDPKKFHVCSLPDTAPFVAKILYKHVFVVGSINHNATKKADKMNHSPGKKMPRVCIC